jgi:hypothetical protein
MQNKTLFLSLMLLAAGGALSELRAQAAPVVDTGPVVYQREVFQYQRSGRPDPFRSLIGSADLGVRVEDMALKGVIHHADANQSLAVFAVTGRERPLRMRVGDRLGGITIAAILPRRVDLLVTEFGVTRRESIQLKPASERGTE